MGIWPFLTFFHADFGKEFPWSSRTLCRGASWNSSSPSCLQCPSLYRTEHFSRGKKGRESAERRGGRWVARTGGKTRGKGRVKIGQIPAPKIAEFEAKKGIPKNLSSQVVGEVRVNFWGEVLLKPFISWVEGPSCSESSWEGFGSVFAIGRLLRSQKNMLHEAQNL